MVPNGAEAMENPKKIWKLINSLARGMTALLGPSSYQPNTVHHGQVCLTHSPLRSDDINLYL